MDNLLNAILLQRDNLETLAEENNIIKSEQEEN
jgi:hypothetical protein